VRAEPVFIEALSRNPVLQQYIPHPNMELPTTHDSLVQALEALHIDTANLLQTNDTPTKVEAIWYKSHCFRGLIHFQGEAVNALIDLMELYAPETVFFINAWTWGYEDALKAVARRFNARVG
jgi:hypothetical protein